MPSIEDFVQGLSRGKKEVIVPKDSVTELSSDWYVSRLNLPHKGSKRYLRNGRLHAFDMGDHYVVHLDRIDPIEHSIIHMIEDAPFILFMWEELRNASSSVKGAKLADRESENSKWMSHLLVGFALLLAGIFIVLDNALAIDLAYLAASGALFVFGAVIIWRALRIKHKNLAWVNIPAGLFVMVLAVVMSFVPESPFGHCYWYCRSGPLGAGFF